MTDGIPKIGPIEIKKGEGITYALKRIAQENKAIFSDGKITAKEWDKTLDALIEIQNDRKANNQKSIFGGGTDKTKAGWHNSFVVNPGDKIEFTEEELTKIFNSMGVSFSKTEKTEKPQPPVQPVAPNPPVEEKNSTEGITQEQRTDENGAAYTADIKDGQEVKRTYKRGDGTLSKVYEYQDGREVKYTDYADDGETVNRTSETEYDSSGNKAKETWKRGDGTVSSVYEYQDGREVKYTVYAADGETVNRTCETEYDSSDNKAKETWKRGDGTVSSVYEYQDGREVKYTVYAADGETVNRTCETEYDSSDNKAKETWKRGDGTVSSVYEYQDGREVKYTVYAADGETVNRTCETEYDSSDNKAKETWKRGDGTLSSVYEYQDDKVVKKIDYAADGRTAQRIIENEQVKMVRISSKTANDSTVSYEYNFDENGVCNQSGLADDLKKQISGPSLNSNTIALLKRITPENVVKVLTSYQATAGQSLQDAINEEWGLGKEEIDEYINKALEKRKQDLGAPADISFEDLIKLDYKKHGD